MVLPKPGKDRREPSSYRPITLLSHVGNLFERLLLRRISPYILLRPEQFGFRSGHSTTLQLTRVLHHLADRRNSGQYTVAVLLDIEKAFDRVWHEGLVHKLRDAGLPHAHVRLLGSYLEGRTFFVAVEGA
ncbi:reverse transcriptase family protein, partial [Pseudomonas aeruginosa]